jgi:hypothetical protein
LPVVLILIGNTVCALGLFCYALIRERQRKSTFFLLSGFVLACPVAAPVFLSSSALIAAFLKTKDVDMKDISFSKDRERAILPPDSEIEMNYVPLEDAMALADTGNLRQLLIDILKSDKRRTLTAVARAIDNPDTEVSHYAAVAILDILSSFRGRLQGLLRDLANNPDDAGLNIHILEYVYQTIEMNVMKESERRYTVDTANGVAENLFTHNLWYVKDEHCLWMTDLLISIGEYERARVWVERAWEYHADKLNAFKARLHLFYATKEVEAFFACIAELKVTDIPVDKEVLDLIRIYG